MSEQYEASIAAYVTALKRWVAQRIEIIKESPGDERVLEQPSSRALYADYCAHVPAEVRWHQWRWAGEFTYQTYAKQYSRKAVGGKNTTAHYSGVRLKAG